MRYLLFALLLLRPLASQPVEELNFTKNIGMLLLAIYLILAGLLSIFGFAIPSIILGVLALLAGIMILLGK